MTPFIRWSLAIASVLAAGAGAVFVMAYSSIAASAAAWMRMELPTVTRWVDRLAPFGLLVVAVLLGGNLVAIARRSDHSMSLISLLAWLFAIAWPLLYLLAWRLPYMLIGHRIGG